MAGEASKGGEPIQFHRLVPPLIGELSVVRHQVYWYPGSLDNGPEEKPLEKVDEIRAKTWGPKSVAGGPFRDCPFNSYQPNNRVRYIYVWWKGMLAHVRLQRHTEYVSILTSLNFSRAVEIDNRQFAGAKDYADEFEFDRAEVQALFALLGSEWIVGHGNNAALDRLLGPLDATVEDKSLFVEFDDDFNMNGLRDDVLSHARIGKDPSRIEMINDFRGLITSAPPGEGGRGRKRGAGVEEALFKPCFRGAAMPVRGTSLFLSKGDSAIPEEMKWLQSGGKSPWYVEKIGDYWRAVQPDAEVEDQEEIEFSATGLLDGRAIFITHLAKAPKDEGDTDRSPTRFYLHCKQSDERQIGRVVDRLCTMATARAALERHAAQIIEKRTDLRILLGSIAKSTDGLIKQNQILNRIILNEEEEEEPSSVSQSHPSEAEPSSGSAVDPAGGIDQGQGQKGDVATDYFSRPSGDNGKKGQSSRDVLRTLSSGMSKLESAIQDKLQFKARSDEAPVGEAEAGGGTLPPSATSATEEEIDPWDADNYMEYKVDRATYHFDRFTRLSEQVRIARVEGFQTYPELVKRRMEDAFAFVRNAKDYLREIAEQRTRMSAQIGNITQIVEAHESDEEQRKIAEIQDFAEFALLTFLVPYYLGTILKYAFETLHWETAKYSVFAGLIIFFTAINLIKRGLEGKLTRRKFWIGPKEKLSRPIGSVTSFMVSKILWFFSSINVLSLLAIVGAFWILGEMQEYVAQHPPTTQASEEKGCSASSCSNTDASQNKASSSGAEHNNPARGAPARRIGSSP